MVLSFSCTSLTESIVVKSIIGIIAGGALVVGLSATPVLADPAEDALAKLTELSRQAEQLTEAMHTLLETSLVINFETLT